MRLRWTLQAADDLAAIKEFIERDSATYARQVIEQLYEAAAGLVAFPDVGRAVPERGQENIREILRPPYRIIYRRGAEIIEILTIHHSSRLLPKEFERGAV
jgi:toxin ParE1/3/4